jgi:hypothetical protein
LGIETLDKGPQALKAKAEAVISENEKGRGNFMRAHNIH